MTNERLMEMAVRNHKKAVANYIKTKDRKGITEPEIKNLMEKVEYAEMVMNLVRNHTDIN